MGGSCGAGLIYQQTIPSGSLPTSSAQCQAWHTFQASLTGSYSTVVLSGSNDPVGVTCTGNAANQICQALHNNTVVSVACGGKTWNVGNCAVSGYESELSADGSTCSCDNPGYIARPCIGNDNWGGIKGATCQPPQQTITVQCK